MSCLKKVMSILLIGMLLMSSAMAASGQHKVTASKLYFREEKSSDSDVIATLSKGTVVTVLSTGGGWAKARCNGKEGYLSTEYLDYIREAPANGKNTTKLSGTAYLEKDAMLYEAADTSSDQVGRIEKGTRLSLRGETMSFYYVKADGEYGYVLKSRVSFDEVKKDEDEKESKGSSANEDSKKDENPSVLSLGCECEAVRELQKRLNELGYLKESCITGYFGELTEKAVMTFQTVNSLTADGLAGQATRKKLASGSAKEMPEVIEMDWFDTDVHSMVYKRGGTAKIIDCKTGVTINIRRVGGYNHMDVEPLKASDTAKLKKLYGGEWSWDRRAVILVVDGKYIAASINGMPHGAEISTSNNFDGQFCLHTTNSRTHGTDRVDSAHQKCVRQALHYEF